MGVCWGGGGGRFVCNQVALLIYRGRAPSRPARVEPKGNTQEVRRPLGAFFKVVLSLMNIGSKDTPGDVSAVRLQYPQWLVNSP